MPDNGQEPLGEDSAMSPAARGQRASARRQLIYSNDGQMLAEIESKSQSDAFQQEDTRNTGKPVGGAR
jgi:hypothetical protein